MVSLKCAVLVTKANDKSSPLTLHLAEVLAVYCNSALRWGEGGRGFKRLHGLAGVPDLRTDLTRRVRIPGIFKQGSS